MKKIVLILVLTVPAVHILLGQENWKYSMYDKVDHTNFRSQSIFNQSYDFDEPDVPLMNAALFFLTNEIRVEKGMDALKYSSICEIAAYHHSKSMVELDFFSHTNSKDKKRKSTEDRAKLAGASNPKIAENIAYNFPGGSSTYLQAAEKFIDQWMDSKGHRENILSDQAKEFGCGVYPSGKYIYATQVFQWFYFMEESGSASDQLPPEKS